MKKNSYLPFLFFLLLFLLLGTHLSSLFQESSLSLSLGQLPLQHEGRVKPLNSLAKQFLMMSQGREKLPGYSPSLFFFTLMQNPKEVASIPFIRIDHPDIKTFVHSTDNKYFSLQQLDPYKQELRNLSLQAQSKSSKTPYDTQVIQLHYTLFLSFSFMNSFRLVDTEKLQEELSWGKELSQHPPSPSQEKADNLFHERYTFLKNVSLLGFFPSSNPSISTWQNLGDYVLSKDYLSKPHPMMEKWIRLFDHPTKKHCKELLHTFYQQNPQLSVKIQAEYWLSQCSPFTFLAGAFFLLFLTLLVGEYCFSSPPSFLMTLSFSCLTLIALGALATRMWVYGRPPVTDLASSALFIACCTLLLALLFAKQRLSLLIGSLLASTCLQLSYYLHADQDPFSPLRAVLDSNFWLSTHVLTITLGYALTLFSSLFATALLLKGASQASFSLKPYDALLYKLTLLSLITVTVGTLLGGVWADQSWGRFWGWDPKENGALMIALYQALILHGRRLGVFKTPTMTLLISLGSVVTMWSWFGVNMLGVGLHSYGFIEEGFFYLVLFALVQLSVSVVAIRFYKR